MLRGESPLRSLVLYEFISFISSFFTSRFCDVSGLFFMNQIFSFGKSSFLIIEILLKIRKREIAVCCTRHDYNSQIIISTSKQSLLLYANSNSFHFILFSSKLFKTQQISQNINFIAAKEMLDQSMILNYFSNDQIEFQSYLYAVTIVFPVES